MERNKNGIINEDVLHDLIETLKSDLPQEYRYNSKQKDIGKMIINYIQLGYKIPIDWVLEYNVSIKLQGAIK